MGTHIVSNFFLWVFIYLLGGGGLIVVNMKIASFILEMWFNWHESLWACFPEFVKVWLSAHFFSYLLISVSVLFDPDLFMIFVSHRISQKLKVLILSVMHYPTCSFNL